MRLPLDSEDDLLVAAGCLYLPLLFDPDIARDLNRLSLPPGEREAPPWLLKAGGRPFIKAVDLASLLENFPRLWPQDYCDLRLKSLKQAGLGEEPEASPLDDRLSILLFQVLPHFLKRSRALARERLTREELLGLIAARVAVPRDYRQRAAAFGRKEAHLSPPGAAPEDDRPTPAAPEGQIPAAALSLWFMQTLGETIISEERRRRGQALAERHRLAREHPHHLALLLYLADKGSLEVDGFGFARHPGTRDEYLIYKRTGEYGLKDFLGRLYLFPDCRVAVSTRRRLRPMVLESYKHPLLHRLGPGQEICLPQDFDPPLEFTGANVIKALEAGLNALYYGYNPRRRNGYHSLDRVRLERTVDFDDYRIPADHPKIASGEVEVKELIV